MTDETEGVLQMQENGRWAIMRDGRMPHELISGDVFRVLVPDRSTDPHDIPLDTWEVTRMEYQHVDGARGYYYSVDGHKLFDGRRAKVGSR